MKVSVAGKGVSIGESFQEYAEEKIRTAVEKYMDRVNVIDIVASKHAHEFSVSINGNTGTSEGIILKSNAKAADIYPALDAAVDKIEKQLRRYKRKLNDHHRTNDSVALSQLEAVQYTLSSDDEEEEATQ